MRKSKVIGAVAVAVGMAGLTACSGPSEDAETVEPTPTHTETATESPGADSEPQSTPEEDPDTDSAPERQDVPIDGFNATYTYVDPFQVYVIEAYVDEDGYITDGGAFYETAPPGMEYQIFNLKVTNNGSYPAPFETYGTRGYDAEGRQYTNDEEAEFTIADDYFWTELNPGSSAEADIVFLMPEDVQLVEVQVQGYGSLIPME